MKFYQCEPRSEEWFKMRIGIPTSSDFGKIITPKTLKISSQAQGYMCRLLAEWVTGEQEPDFQSEYMIRGQDLEDDAFAAYELLTGSETTPGGFFTTSDGMLGCSPDRLIGESGDLELKSPLLRTQIGYALNGLDDEYKCQVQGRLMIHERDYVDLFSYHPRFSIPPLRIGRDEKFIGIMRPVLATFVETLLKAREELESRFGPFVRDVPSKPTVDGLGITDEDLEAIIMANENLQQRGF